MRQEGIQVETGQEINNNQVVSVLENLAEREKSAEPVKVSRRGFLKAAAAIGAAATLGKDVFGAEKEASVLPQATEKREVEESQERAKLCENLNLCLGKHGFELGFIDVGPRGVIVTIDDKSTVTNAEKRPQLLPIGAVRVPVNKFIRLNGAITRHAEAMKEMPDIIKRTIVGQGREVTPEDVNKMKQDSTFFVQEIADGKIKYYAIETEKLAKFAKYVTAMENEVTDKLILVGEHDCDYKEASLDEIKKDFVEKIDAKTVRLRGGAFGQKKETRAGEARYYIIKPKSGQ